MSLQIEIKDISVPKITITPDRQVLKIHPSTSEEEKKKLENFALLVIDKIGPVVQSVRGRIYSHPKGGYIVNLVKGDRREPIGEICDIS